MNHDRFLFFSFFVNISHIKSFGHNEIILHGEGGVLLAAEIFHLNVNFRAVKSGFAFGFEKRRFAFSQYFAKRFFGEAPGLVVFVIFFRVAAVAQRQAVAEIFAFFQSQGRSHIFYQIKRAVDFLGGLLRAADDVRVGKAETAHPYEAGQFAGFFVAELFGQFRDPERQFFVRSGLCQIQLEMVRAGHRPQNQFFLVNFHRRIHRIFEIGVMAGSFVKLHFGKLRRVDMPVTAFYFFVHHESFQFAPDD